MNFERTAGTGGTGARRGSGSGRRWRHCLPGMPAVLAGATLMAVVLGFVAVAPAVADQEARREVRQTFAAADVGEVELENLAGIVKANGGEGDVEIVAVVHAAAGTAEAAEDLVGRLDVEFDLQGDRLEVVARFPVDEFDTFHYPSRDRHHHVHTTSDYLGERVRVTSEASRRAVTLYVDFRIRLPEGTGISVRNVAGEVEADEVRGPVAADTGAGDVTVTGGEGWVNADTGSGDVLVESRYGRVQADTGSGDVTVRQVKGDVMADTGSGDVTLTDVEGERVLADTGSGDVEMERVSGSITADTGSGEIFGRDLVAKSRLYADTGSGDVRLWGDLSRVEGIEIDTGSGDVELEMTAMPEMRLTISTGSGDIEVELPDLRVLRTRRSYFEGQTGDGRTRVEIETGSGDVRIRSRS